MNLLTLLVLLIVSGYVATIYFKLSSLAKQHRLQETEIDNTLKKRFEIFSKLIESLKEGMDIEKSNLGQVPILREQALTAQKSNDQKTRIGLEDEISNIAVGISFVFEQHLKLKENQTAREHHLELIKVEENLAHQKEKSNAIIDKYQKTNTGIIPLILNKLFPKQLTINSEHWNINSEALEGRENYSVQLR